uniref:Uncharacterized protein n=1 Tax=Anguilla anguilla TaxID=7936 RepID=A0A0E9VSP2_ANGAN
MEVHRADNDRNSLHGSSSLMH